MPQLEFFAAREDQLSLLGFLFSEGIRILEHASIADHEVKEFKSPDEIDRHFPPGVGRAPVASLLALWASTAIRKISFRRIDFNPGAVPNARFRYVPESGGLMQLYLGAIEGSTLAKTHFGHFSEKGAGRWNVDEGVDWTELMRVSRRIQSHIRRKMAVDKVPGRILPEAAKLWKSGWALKEATNSPWHWEPSGLVHDP